MKALDAANYLVYLMSDVCDDLTNMKLNKLLYYAQGHYLQKHGVPMFEDTIEAWDHGPVVAEVYNQYKVFENSVITTWNPALVSSVPPGAADILFEVAREYGKYTASALRNMTHVPNGPWDEVHHKGERHTAIPISSIRAFFSRPDAKQLHPLELNFTNDDFAGYRDSNGMLVLPREWNDEAL